MRQRHIGIVRSDIQINFFGDDNRKILQAIERVKKALRAVEGVVNVSDNLQLGKKEYRFTINPYGRNLGVEEAEVARTLSGYFLQRRQSLTFGKEGVVEIKTRALNKDEVNTLLDFEIPLDDCLLYTSPSPRD